MIATAALTDDPEFDEITDSSLDTRNTCAYFVGNVLVRWKTKTLLVSMCRQAVVNRDADWFEFVAIFIKKHFANPIPIAIS